MKVLLIDNNDSFTYNIVEILRSINRVSFEVIPYSCLDVGKLNEFNNIIISPGPMIPSDYPKHAQVISFCEHHHKPLLGICLGHQSICAYYGNKLVRMEKIIHGQKKRITIDNRCPLFSQLPNKIDVGLYHSWKIDHQTLSNELTITGISDDDCLMAVQKTGRSIFGTQFHPESFLTPMGKQILDNFTAILL